MTSASRSLPPLAGALLFAIRMGLAGVFVAAALPKIAAPDLFAGAIFNYQMLSPWAVNLAALTLPWMEFFVGACLALGLWTRASALLVAGMMLVFMVAFSVATARGLNIACGCFEVSASEEPSSVVWVVLRDLGLCGAALVVAKFDTAPSLRSLWRLFRRRATPAIC